MNRTKKMWTRRLGAAVATTWMCLVLAPLPTAMAQDGGGLVFTTTTGATTSAGVLTTLGVVWLVMPKDKAQKAMLHYMKENRAAVEETIAVRHGEALPDLAAMAGISQPLHGRFADALAKEIEERGTSLLSGEEYSPQHAELLLDCMRSAVESDAILRDEMERHAPM